MDTAPSEPSAPPPRRYSATPSRHHVDFFCDAPQAKSVRLVGDFNGWDLAATPLGQMPDRRWMVSLELPHGHHHYLFVIDGIPALDPNAHGIAHLDPNEAVSLIAVS